MKPFAFILLFLFGLWCYGSAHWYTCKIKYLCNNEEGMVEEGIESEVGQTAGRIEEVVGVERSGGKNESNDTEPSEEVNNEDEKKGGFEIETLEDKVIIHFPLASSNPELNEALNNYMDDLMITLKSNNKKVVLTGFTDNTGSSESNLRLGQKRGEAIKLMMVHKGLEAGRISVNSKGEKEPIADNTTEEGRNKNRRVELTIF